jgi:hypothetical protein
VRDVAQREARAALADDRQPAQLLEAFRSPSVRVQRARDRPLFLRLIKQTQYANGYAGVLYRVDKLKVGGNTLSLLGS